MAAMLAGGALQQAPAQNAPPDSTRRLPPVEITARPLRQPITGARVERWAHNSPSFLPATHIGEVLSMQGGVFVKNYGPGALSTTSIRGGSAGHTQVVWNGLPLENPLLGQLDFALLPTGFVDDMTVAFGGNTPSWGSGAIGGTVFLQNKPIDEEGLTAQLTTEAGSFGHWAQQVRWQMGKGKMRNSVRYFHQQAENDFPWSARPSLPRKRMDNAAVRQDGLLHGLYWQPRPGRQLAAHTWWQNTDRQIPPRTVQNQSKAEQKDHIWRTALHWQQTSRRGILSLRAGLFREEQDYTDPLAGVDTENDYWKAIGEVEQQWRFSKKQQLRLSANHTWFLSDARAYGQSRQQHRTAAMAHWQRDIGRWSAQLNLRQELVDGHPVPLVPGAGLRSQLSPHILFRARAGRHYRLPTLNDLYWQPGGNPDLRPEKGWSQEMGLDIHWPRAALTYSATAFNRYINDWIQWARVNGENFWSPHNITAVWSRGTEQRLKVNFHFNKIITSLAGGHDFIRSTYQQAVVLPRFDKGEQLAYTPRHQWFARLSAKWQTVAATYLHRFYGKVGTFAEDPLPGYHTGAVHLRTTWHYHRLNGNLWLHIYNVWNARYQSIAFRPMPGRHLRIGVWVNTNPRKK